MNAIDLTQNNSRVILYITSSLIHDQRGSLNYSLLADVAKLISDAHKVGIEIILILSGSIFAGSELCKDIRNVPLNKHALIYYSIGKIHLLNFYRDMFFCNGVTIGEISVSRSTFSNRSQYISIRETINGLLCNKIIPIIVNNYILNENTQNDSRDDNILASYIAGMISANRVIFLTNQDGIFLQNNEDSPSPIQIIDSDLSILNNDSIKTLKLNKNIINKFPAIFLLWELGIDTTICNGLNNTNIKNALLLHNVGTSITPQKTKRLSGIRKWLATGAMPKGNIVLSRIGAEVLLRPDQRGSLLARGIEKFSGNFDKGDVVSVCDDQGKLLGYGVTKYGTDELPILLAQDNIIVIHANYFYGSNLEWFS